MDKVTLVGQLFKEGYNCAQSVAVAFCEEIGMDKAQAAKAVSGFGGGMGRMREVCGAVSGMIFVLSCIEGYSEPGNTEGKRELYAKVQELSARFKEARGSIICRELLKGEGRDASPIPSERTEEYYARRKGCLLSMETAARILQEHLGLI